MQYECCVFCVWAYVHAGCVHAVFAVCGVSSRCAPLAVCEACVAVCAVFSPCAQVAVYVSCVLSESEARLCCCCCAYEYVRVAGISVHKSQGM